MAKQQAEKDQQETLKKWIHFKSWWHTKSKRLDQSHKGHKRSPFKAKIRSPSSRSPKKRLSPKRMSLHQSDNTSPRFPGDSPSNHQKGSDHRRNEKSADESDLTLLEIINPIDHHAISLTSTPSRKRYAFYFLPKHGLP